MSDALDPLTDFRTLPEVQLPGGSTTITYAAERLGHLLGQTGKFFVRGGAVMRLDVDDDGELRLKQVRPAAACSDFERVAKLMRVPAGKDGEQIVPTNCSETTARLILESCAFRDAMPAIKVLSRCPVLIERGGRLVQVVGYDRESGILAAGEQAPDLDLSEGIELLEELVAEFNFAMQGDRARALAAIVTPALVLGGLLRGRAPVDLGEADQSQSGKGYRNKILAGVYNSRQRTVTQRSGGVGSTQETFDAALVSGAWLVSFDNFRGRLDFPGLESFLTEDNYMARVPYGSPIEIDPRRTVVMVTSNRAEVTIDLANRSSCIRIAKHRPGHKFKKYPEGDLLDHVCANQPRYLGAVFSVVREWYRLGKPELEAVEHDFRRWARVLGWISVNLLGSGDLLAGHRAAQQRIASPALNWLRDVALAVKQASKLDQWLRANQILQIVIDASIETPGLNLDTDDDDHGAWLKNARAIGRKLGKLFDGDELTIDSFVVRRENRIDHDHREKTEYAFSSETPNTPNSTPNGNAETPNTPNRVQHFFETSDSQMSEFKKF